MIGALKHSLRLQEQHRVPDGGGGWHTVWQDVTLHPLVYAAIETAGGGERMRFHKREPETSHILRIRYRGDITSGMRFIGADGSYSYDVLSAVDRRGDERWLEIAVRRKKA